MIISTSYTTEITKLEANIFPVTDLDIDLGIVTEIKTLKLAFDTCKLSRVN